MKIVIEGQLHQASIEDGGQSMICEFDNTVEQATDGYFFVRLQSWNEDKKHPTLAAVAGHRVRVTVDVLDEK